MSEILLADGLDAAYVGMVYRFFSDPIACYDIDKILQIYVDRDGMTEEEALEFFEYNVIGAWVGDGTPCFIRMNEDPHEVADRTAE